MLAKLLQEAYDEEMETHGIVKSNVSENTLCSCVKSMCGTCGKNIR